MQTSKPPLAPCGVRASIILEGSTAGLGDPVGYIAILVSGPSQEPPAIQTQTTPQPVCRPPSKQQRQPRHATGLTKRLQKAIGGLGAAQIVTGLASITAESISYEVSENYKGALAGIWCGVLFFVTGVIAVCAATSRRFGLIITTMVMSIVSAIFFALLLSLTAVFTYIDEDWNKLPQVIRALEMTLSVLELIFSIACSVCCCQAVCRKNCCFCCIGVTINQNPPPVVLPDKRVKALR